MSRWQWNFLIGFFASLPVFGWVYPFYLDWANAFLTRTNTGEDVFLAVSGTVLLAGIIVAYFAIVLFLVRPPK